MGQKPPADLVAIVCNQCCRIIKSCIVARVLTSRVLLGKGNDTPCNEKGSGQPLVGPPRVLVKVLGDKAQGEARDVGRGNRSSTFFRCAIVPRLVIVAGDVTARGENIDACYFPVRAEFTSKRKKGRVKRGNRTFSIIGEAGLRVVDINRPDGEGGWRRGRRILGGIRVVVTSGDHYGQTQVDSNRNGGV